MTNADCTYQQIAERGQISLLPLLDSVLDAVEVPVVAAGGIGTPRAMAASPPVPPGCASAPGSWPPTRPAPLAPPSRPLRPLASTPA